MFAQMCVPGQILRSADFQAAAERLDIASLTTVFARLSRKGESLHGIWNLG